MDAVPAVPRRLGALDPTAPDRLRDQITDRYRVGL
jgi:hypothetical protein